MIIDDTDRLLLSRLRRNSRESIAELARSLKLSRSTIKDRLDRLESKGIIKGYSLVLSKEFTRGHVSAHVMVNVESQKSASVIRNLRQITHIRTAYAVSGIYDLIVVVEADSTGELDQVLDRVRDIDGIEKTLTSVMLSTKFEQ